MVGKRECELVVVCCLVVENEYFLFRLCGSEKKKLCEEGFIEEEIEGMEVEREKIKVFGKEKKWVVIVLEVDDDEDDDEGLDGVEEEDDEDDDVDVDEMDMDVD